MNTSRAMRFCLVFNCLLLASTVSRAQQPAPQQPAPHVGQRVPPPLPVPKQGTVSPGQKLARQCREFLAPQEELQSRFEIAANDELESAAKRAVRCGDLTDVRLLRAAFVAYRLARDEQDARSSRDSKAVFTSLVDMQWDTQQEQQEKYEAELKKQHADFAEAANFAAALFKEYQQYKEAYEDETRYYDKLKERYHETYDIAVEAINLAGNRLSLPAFVSVPAPQIIRIETPAVPRSLYCTSSTMPPAAPGLETWTWTNCHW